MFHCTITLRRGQDSEEIIIHHFHIAHNTSCLPLPTKKNWITTVCSQSITIVSRGIKENAYANFWSVKMNKISVSWEMFKW